MKTRSRVSLFGLVLVAAGWSSLSEGAAEVSEKFFRLIDFFDLEFASDPQISPNGEKAVFVRNFSDIMKDRKRSNLWIVDTDSGEARPLTTGHENDFSPGWSPDGKRLLYASSAEGSVQLYVRWTDSGQAGKVTSVQKTPREMTWSPDGEWIAFSMLLPGEADYRTPISESEQFYQALKLRKVETALVRLPEASHGMDSRPTQVIMKVAHILKWFEKHRTDMAKQ